MDRLGITVENCTDPGVPNAYGCPPRNYMTRYFCGHGAPCADPPDDATFALARPTSALLAFPPLISSLARVRPANFPLVFRLICSPPPTTNPANNQAAEHLLHTYAFVGVLEEARPSLAVLQRMFPGYFPNPLGTYGKVNPTNRNAKRKYASFLSAAVREKVRAANEYDWRLYTMARGARMQRVGCGGFGGTIQIGLAYRFGAFMAIKAEAPSRLHPPPRINAALLHRRIMACRREPAPPPMKVPPARTASPRASLSAVSHYLSASPPLLAAVCVAFPPRRSWSKRRPSTRSRSGAPPAAPTSCAACCPTALSLPWGAWRRTRCGARAAWGSPRRFSGRL